MEGVDRLPILGHVRLALEQHEELVTWLAHTGQLLALGEVDLVGELRDLLELAARASANNGAR